MKEKGKLYGVSVLSQILNKQTDQIAFLIPRQHLEYV
jgi:hypothetical protein